MQNYVKPTVQNFGTFRELTLAGYGPQSDGGCLLGCNNTGLIDPQCSSLARS